MIGDITILSESAFGYAGDVPFQVEAGADATILPGEPVAKALGQQYAAAAATNTPVVGTDFFAGIAATKSTDTVAADGSVTVTRLAPGTIYLIDPNDPTAWDTQSEYDALVGARVLLDLTDGKWTILATDGATHGCVVEQLDIKKHPGKVAFSFRDSVTYLA